MCQEVTYFQKANRFTFHVQLQPRNRTCTPPWFPKKQWGTKKCCRLVAMLCNNYKTRRVQGSENSQGMWTVKSPALRKRPGGGGSNCKIIGKGQAFNKTVLAGTFYSHSWKTKTAHTCFLIWYLITDRKMKSTRYIPFYPPQWSSSKSLNSQCWRGPAEKGSLLCQCWGWKSLQTLRSTEWRFLKILKMQISCDPAIPH